MPKAPLPDWARRGREGWTHRGSQRPSFAHVPQTGQESVWDYPRPPALVPDERRVRVRVGTRWIADTRASLRLLETSHPPTFYVPRADVDMSQLQRAGSGSRCEWKGLATYFDATGAPGLAWSYEQPFGEYEALAGHLAFYASKAECFVGEERALPQPGGFYGGWITPELAGPFKGDPGSGSW